jgi:hypothetical protein
MKSWLPVPLLVRLTAAKSPVMPLVGRMLSYLLEHDK